MKAALLTLCLALGACSQDRQPRYEPHGRAALLPGGQVDQPPPPGALAREDAPPGQVAARPAMSAALLARGQARYEIACAPCHGVAGDGDGVVTRRGFPRPAAFADSERLTSGRVVDVITRGYGVMYSHADRVTPDDRWAIAAYVQALRFSQSAPAADLPAEDRARLEAADAR